MILFFFFFNDTATTEIYTLSLHDALPILVAEQVPQTDKGHDPEECAQAIVEQEPPDAHAEQPGESRRDGAQSRNELGADERPHPVSAEKGLCSTYARVRFKRDAAEQVQDMPAAIASQVVPDEIPRQAGGHTQGDSHTEVQLAGPSQRPSGEQHWDCGNG